MLSLSLDGGCHAVVRPSGTEPKLKIYLTARAGTADASMAAVDAMARACRVFVEG